MINRRFAVIDLDREPVIVRVYEKRELGFGVFKVATYSGKKEEVAQHIEFARTADTTLPAKQK